MTSSALHGLVHPVKSARCAGIALAVGLSVLAAAGSVSAQTSETRSRTESIFRSLEADSAARALTQGLIARAQKIVARAEHARGAGDQRHGTELEALALELAATALDLTRAVRAENDVASLEQRALETENRVVRARALVEQTAARRGRAGEQLRAAEQQAREQKAKP